ncbi:MAG: hypothetical protein ABI760_23765 [Ferruginibacter sp.]
MKKTITILASVALLTSAAFAQNNHQRDDSYGNNRDREMAVNNNWDRNSNERGSYYFSAGEKDMEISSINREYYRKIESVKNKLFMRRAKKERLVCALESQLNDEIRSVIAKFNDRRNRFDRRDGWHHDHDKRNNW